MVREQDQAKLTDAYYESMQEEWQQLTGRMITPDDYWVMQTLRLDGVPLDVVQSTLREQVPKRKRKPLAYHRPAILEAWKRQQELAAPAANWEGYESGAPKGWEVERSELAGKIKAECDVMADIRDELPAGVAAELFGLVCETVEAAGSEAELWPAWAKWKREAAEIAVREGVEPDVVGEIIWRVGA